MTARRARAITRTLLKKYRMEHCIVEVVPSRKLDTNLFKFFLNQLKNSHTLGRATTTLNPEGRMRVISQKIQLNDKFVKNNSEYLVTQCIIHEIAHIIDQFRYTYIEDKTKGHYKRWAKLAKKIGYQHPSEFSY